MAAKAIVGPVVGKVTENSARILLEASENTTVDGFAIAMVGQTTAPIQATVDLKRGIPGILRFRGLKPNTRYIIYFSGIRAQPATFKTFSKDHSRMNIGVVSCNKPGCCQETDLWGDLYHRYVKTGEMDLLLHVGDQVYGDEAYSKAVRKLEGRRVGTKAQQHHILELYREIYRTNWGFETTRQVLASVPSLMMWDDHEIRDDWGSLPGDKNPNSQAYHIGTLARQVYREYQRQLWDDDVIPPAGQLEDHYHAWGDIGVLFVDQRGGRSFESDPARPYLSIQQWERIRRSLAPSGELGNVRALVVVSTVPLVYLGSTVGNLFASHSDDRPDHWSYKPHQPEQIEMLRLLRRWKQGKTPNGESRELLVVGGDVHMATHTEVKHRNKTIFEQLITSPITNRPPGWLQYTLMKGVLELDQTISKSYSFEHSGYSNNRNFGFIEARCSPNRVPRLDAGLYQG